MLRALTINKYISKEFLKIVINMSLAFFCLGYIVNFFEEINFFKDYNVGIDLPLIMSALFVPSLLYNMFPFIILFSGIWFFLRIKKTDEIIGMKVSGMSNFSVIIIPSFVSIVLGIFFITAVNPITSTLVKKYESIKGSYEIDKDYLAAITVNGIWIKEKKLNNYSIIRAKSLNKENLLDISIYEFDNENNFVQRIEANSADITSLTWNLKNAQIIDKEGNVSFKNLNNLFYQSMYDIKKIKSLYSNLDTVSFWSLNNEIQLLEERGYSTREMRSKLQRSLAFPFFLLGMILLSGVFTLGIEFKENNWTYVFIAIMTSVLIYFFNDFSAVLGKTERLPVEISVWMPILIIFIFSAIGLIHANKK